MKRLAGLLISTVIFFTGCSSSPVVQDVDQGQANEIVAVLSANGISARAEKERSGRGRYQVLVSPNAYSEAVSLIHEKGLPGEVRPSVEELIQPSGILPSSREAEALRIDYALAGQLEELLRSDGRIAEAKVVLRLHSLREGPPAASISVQHRSGTAPLNPADVIAMLRPALPELSESGLGITITPESGAETVVRGTEGVARQRGVVIRIPLVPFLSLWRVPESDYASLALTLTGFVLLVGGLCAVIGYWVGVYRRVRRSEELEVPELIPALRQTGRGEQREVSQARLD